MRLRCEIAGSLALLAGPSALGSLRWDLWSTLLACSPQTGYFAVLSYSVITGVGRVLLRMKELAPVVDQRRALSISSCLPRKVFPAEFHRLRFDSHLSQSTLFFRPYLRRRPTECVWVNCPTDSGTQSPVYGRHSVGPVRSSQLSVTPTGFLVRRGRSIGKDSPFQG